MITEGPPPSFYGPLISPNPVYLYLLDDYKMFIGTDDPVFSLPHLCRSLTIHIVERFVKAGPTELFRVCIGLSN